MSDYSIDFSIMQAKKEESFKLADSFDRLSRRLEGPTGARDGWANRAALCRNCGNYLKFGVLKAGGVKLVDANFCRQRLCPQCSYRRSLRAYAHISRCLDWVCTWNSGIQFAFLTLTIRNVEGPELSAALTAMTDAYNRFLCNDAVKRRIAGAIRTTEVTVNSDDNTYHPHFHLILALPDDYYLDAKKYWTTEQWAKAWKTSGGYNYTPVTHIEAIRGQENAVKETAKYAVKPGDLLRGCINVIDERVLHLQIGLHRKRLLSYSGVFADARRALKIAEEEHDSLTDDISREDVFEAFVTYNWGLDVGNYQLVKEE